MPIRPIEIFNRQSTGLDQLLSRGTSALQQSIDSAVQIGRDQSNNQARQERDFISERSREINLRQRRAENLQQDLEDKQQFDEEKRRFNVKFGRDVLEDERDFTESGRRFEITSQLNREQEQRLSTSAANQEAREGALQPLKIKDLEARIRATESAEERAQLTQELEDEKRAVRSTTSAQIAKMIQSGDLDGAKALYNERVLNPDLGYDATEQRTFATQLGIETSGSESGAKVPAYVSDAEDLRTLNQLSEEQETVFEDLTTSDQKKIIASENRILATNIEGLSPAQLQELDRSLSQVRASPKKEALRERIHTRLANPPKRKEGQPLDSDPEDLGNTRVNLFSG